MTSTDMPTSLSDRIKYIDQERRGSWGHLALEGKKTRATPDPASSSKIADWVRKVDKLLAWLEAEVTMSPKLKKGSQIDVILERMFNPTHGLYFSQKHQDQARKLYEKWTAEDWGAPPPQLQSRRAEQPAAEDSEQSDNDDDFESDISEAENEPSAKRRKTSAATGSSGFAFNLIKPVPREHPVWGENGIMHGLARKMPKEQGGNTSTVLDPQLEHKKKNCKVFGHNGIDVGCWYPTRLSALFNGAHGLSQAGIHGTPSTGAWSIVVSQGYEGLDRDYGKTILYSGSGSHTNTDPRFPAAATAGTQALDMSIHTGKSVRVLRDYKGDNRFRPTKGIRYDGLYTVVDKQYPKNAKGGMYERFELERVPNQRPLEECRSRPSPRELELYEMIAQGYPSRR